MTARPPDGPEKRHHAVVRITHWVNVVALTFMVGSGLRIFNAYPRFAPRGGSFCCYPFEGRSIPEWLTFGGWLAGARNWHFAMMWVLVVNGLVYLGWIYLRGEWRDLVPRKGDVRDVWQMIRFYLTLRPDHPRQGKHNALQKLAYFSVPILAGAAVVSGVAIWKPVTLGWLADLLGGYVWARYWHFLAMLGMVGFTLGHVFMVLAVDRHSMRAMVTGHYDDSRSPEARNARPFGRGRTPAEAPSAAPAAEEPESLPGRAPEPEAGPDPEPRPRPEPASEPAPETTRETGEETSP